VLLSTESIFEVEMRHTTLFFVFALIMTVACSSSSGNARTDTLIRSSSNPKPPWVEDMSAMSRPGKTSFTGRSSGASSERDAIDLAMNNAFSNLSNYFGVSVRSDMISSEQESDGVYSYSIGIESKLTGSVITVKKYSVDATYTEQWNRGRREYDAAVLLSVPDMEMARIQAEVEGAVTWAVFPDNELVRSNIRPFIQELAKKRNVSFRQKDVVLPEMFNYSDVFSQHRTAYLLIIRSEIGKPSEYHGEWYVNIKTTVEFSSLIESKIVDTWTIEEKGGAFDPDSAIENGMKQTFKKLISKL
jgi:hypothetical protein